MDVIAICGSPRRGNTEFALRRLLMKAEEMGHKTELVLLREKKIEHCRGCMVCDESGACPIVDDAAALIEKMKASDLIIFGSPNYCNNVSGTMKDFFDRMNPLYQEKLLGGKKMISVCVGGSSNETYPGKMADVMSSVADLYKLDYAGSMYLVARGPMDVGNNSESVQKIDDFALNILS